MAQITNEDRQIVFNLNQLKRLIIECPAMSFDIAHYVIFSDYPSASFLKKILYVAIESNHEMSKFIFDIYESQKNEEKI